MKKISVIIFVLFSYLSFACSAVDSIRTGSVPVQAAQPDTTITVMHPNGTDSAVVIAVVDGVIKVVTIATAETSGVGALLNNNWVKGSIAAGILGLWYKISRRRKKKKTQA